MNESSLALRPISSLFQSDPTIQPGASVEAEDGLPIRIVTLPEPWSYAFWLNRAEGAPSAGPVCVHVALEVHEGAVGVGCLDRHQTAFIDEEVVESGVGERIVELVALDERAVGALVVRNASRPGAARATVHEVACFSFARDEVGGTRSPGLSEPRPMRRWSRYYGDSDITTGDKLRIQAFRALAAPTVVRWSDGLSFRILPSDSLSRALFVSGTYEPNTLCALRRFLTSGDVFLDIGANAGVISLAASRWVGPTGRVYALEPSTREYSKLQANLERNGTENVTPIRAAVCDRPGRAALRVAVAAHAGLNTLGDRFAYDGVESERFETVETITLDRFVADEDITRVAVVKLDIEGAEGAALAGSVDLLRTQRPILVMEVLDRALRANGSSVSSVERLLADARYRLYAIDDETGGLEPRHDVRDVEEASIVAVPVEREIPGK